jgi:hypothetical protein
MLQGVTFMGLVAPGASATIAGPNGPVAIEGEPAAPLALFRVDGWEPNGTPDGLADEAQGHRLLRLMESVGTAMANDRVDADDVGRLALDLHLPGGKVIQALIPATKQVIAALENDGRIDPKEALAIAGSIVSGVLTLRA